MGSGERPKTQARTRSLACRQGAEFLEYHKEQMAAVRDVKVNSNWYKLPLRFKFSHPSLLPRRFGLLRAYMS